MFSMRAAGVILAGGLIVGCQQHQPPKASLPAEPMNENTVVGLERSWKASHPGSETGVVNAVLPDRRLVSVADLPLDQMQMGNVVTILLNHEGSSTVEAVVVGKNSGFLQLSYPPLEAGQRDPQPGDLAIWIPGSGAVPPSAVEPGAQPGTTTAPAAEPGPTTSPEAPETPTQPSGVPETPTPPVPTTQPGAGTETGGATGASPASAPTTTQTPSAPAVGNQPELNK